MSRFVGLLALLAVASAAQAQGPSADWRTITTEHFRIHYPAQYEMWATRAASRVESIRAAVVKEVGFDPPQRIDIVVNNPIALPNGLAWPLLDAPRIVFYTEPPGPEEQLGAYSDWIDLLAVHEITHILHMLRPSRNPLQRAVERFVLPVDPITLAAPRWVLEGYATVVEGRLTGAGRPPGTMRAIVLRKWAASGRLPSYSQLDSDTRFLGMSMAYLVGSAYLEWLEARTGEGSLRRLWARMTARQRRSFAEAFTGVFGDSPERLYGGFVAELTSSAMTVNRAPLQEGELWQETSRNSGDPAVSPDGSQIALVIRARNKPARLVMWKTGPPEEETKKFEERIAKIVQRDPEDVPPVRVKPLPRKIVHSFTPPDGGDLATPRWTRDGMRILYSHRQPDAEGFLHHDLFLWMPKTGENRRVTQLADVFDADPLPDGRTAIAVRSRYGLSQLVKVDLTTGEVTPVNEPSLETVYSHPRANGSQIAYVSHRQGAWTLSVDDKPLLDGVNVASPEWSGNSIVATVLTGGFAELHQIDLSGEHHPITRSSGGAFDPAPSPDGRLFFMGLEPDGFVVRVTQPSPAEPVAAYDASLVPALPPVIPVPPPFASEALAPSKPYGIGRQEMTWLVSEQIATKQHATELGIRAGDIVGRLDTLVIASLATGNAQRGAAIASTWRGWPIEIAGHAFTADDHLVDRKGLELRGSWRSKSPLASVSIEGGGLTGSPLDIGFLQLTGRSQRIHPAFRAEQELQLSGETGSLRHYRGVASASLKMGGIRIAARYQHDQTEARGARPEALQVGGVESSILPRSAIPNRVFDPALPVGTLSGKRYDGVRIEATIPILPATAFYQRHRTDTASLALAGLQLTFDSDAVPLLRLPALDFTTGVARILDEPLRNRTEWWFAMRWRP